MLYKFCLLQLLVIFYTFKKISITVYHRKKVENFKNVKRPFVEDDKMYLMWWYSCSGRVGRWWGYPNRHCGFWWRHFSRITIWYFPKTNQKLYYRCFTLKKLCYGNNFLGISINTAAFGRHQVFLDKMGEINKLWQHFVLVPEGKQQMWRKLRAAKAANQSVCDEKASTSSCNVVIASLDRCTFFLQKFRFVVGSLESFHFKMFENLHLNHIIGILRVARDIWRVARFLKKFCEVTVRKYWEPLHWEHSVSEGLKHQMR